MVSFHIQFIKLNQGEKKMTSVKQLMAKFSKPGTNATGLSPVSFEEQKKLARQKELEEIRLAREKAKLYNATLRAKTIQLAKEQSARVRGLSPRSGSARTFTFDTSNPTFNAPPVHQEVDEEDEAAVAIDMKDDNPDVFATGPRTEESFEGKNEEKKDVLTEMTCPPTHVSPRLSRLSGNSLNKQDNSLALPPAEEISTRIRTSGNRQLMSNLASAPSMTDVTIPPENHNASFITRASAAGSVRKDSDLHSEISMMGIPEGGFDEIHEAVRFNRPSVSDLLLRPTLGERNYSVTSVGPMVETPSEEPCRLLPGVDIRTVLHTFYQTYAPEKLEDLDLVLRHFKGRTEALLFTLECKYFVSISPDGLVTPYRPSEAPPEADRIEDERQAARRSTMLSTATDFTDFTTDSYKGYIPADAKDGGLPPTLANSWAVRPKHDSGGARREGRKTALLLKKAGSDLL